MDMNKRRPICDAEKRLATMLRFGAMVLVGTCLNAANGKLEISFVDVGQGDASLVTCPDGKHHLLIDSGDNRYPNSAKNFRTFMTNAFNGQSRHIDVVVASHLHADHIGSMEWVLKNFPVNTFIDNGDMGETTAFANLLKERRRQEKAGTLNYINAKENNLLEVDFCPSVRMKIIEPWAKQPALSDPNDRSVAVRLEYEHKSFLFVGDLEDHAEEVMLNQFAPAERAQLDVDVLKVGHHGSDTSSTVPFINAVSPEVAIISVGKKGVSTNVKYQHPRLSTVRHYDDWFKNHLPPVIAAAGKVWAFDADKKVWQQQPRPKGMWLTVEDSTVTVTWDGSQLKVSSSAAHN
jgi:beta-lactamase superfamily II metal-dependent hydrolase